MTNNLKRRIRQHNGLIRGGAKSTRSHKWTFHTIVGTFATKSEAMSFEWHWKRHRAGVINKMKRLLTLLFTEKWIGKTLVPLDDLI